MTFDWVVIIASMGISLSFLVIPLLLYHSYGDKRANLYLSLFVAVLAFMLLYNTLVHGGIIFQYPALSGVGQFLYFALGPLLYLYIKALSEVQFVFLRVHCLHFGAVLISLAGYLPIYFMDIESKRVHAGNYFAMSPADAGGHTSLVLVTEQPFAIYIYLVQFIALAFHLALYAVLGLRLVNRHRHDIGSFFSDIERINLNWVNYLCKIVLLLSAASLGMLALRLLYSDSFSANIRSLPVLITCLLIYCIGMMGVHQPRIYSKKDVAGGTAPGVPTGTAKYKSTGLSDEEAEQLWQRLQEHLSSAKGYLTAGLTVGQLSEELAVSSAHLSQVINTFGGSNFYEFINRYRIKYAQELIRQPTGFTPKVLEIAMESGFNSASTFYSQFKKITGMTPAQYRRSPPAATE